MRVLSVILGIFLIVGGVFLLFNPALATLMLGWFVGFSAVISGIVLIGDFASKRSEGPHWRDRKFSYWTYCFI